MALVTIVLERAWAALKWDQLPVGETHRCKDYLFFFFFPKVIAGLNINCVKQTPTCGNSI